MPLKVIYKSGSFRIALLLLLIPLFAFAVVHWYENKYEQLPVLGGTDGVNGKEVAHYVHPFTLINQDGQLFHSNIWQHKIVVVNFFFTHCGSICPNMMRHLQTVAKAFVGNKTIQLVSFTVDPERDSAAMLKRYATAYTIDSSQWTLLTGHKKDIYRLARKEFFLTATDGDGGESDFIHSDQLVLLDSHQQIRGYYSGVNDQQVMQLIHDIKKLSHE